MSERESLGCDQDFLEVKKFYSGKKEDKYFITKTQLRKKPNPLGNGLLILKEKSKVNYGCRGM